MEPLGRETALKAVGVELQCLHGAKSYGILHKTVSNVTAVV